MKFMDVVQNGVLQAHALAPRYKRGRLTTPARAKRLLAYKGRRVERELIAGLKRGGTPLIIFC